MGWHDKIESLLLKRRHFEILKDFLAAPEIILKNPDFFRVSLISAGIVRFHPKCHTPLESSIQELSEFV